jgi:hypothetical protein
MLEVNPVDLPSGWGSGVYHRVEPVPAGTQQVGKQVCVDESVLP